MKPATAGPRSAGRKYLGSRPVRHRGERRHQTLPGRRPGRGERPRRRVGAIRKNEFFTLLGPSGCGKTTLLRLIAGFDHPTDGDILLEGEDIAPLPPYQRPVNTVFQTYALFPHMTVAQNIGFGLEMLGKPKAEIDDARRPDAVAGPHGGAHATARPARSPAASSSAWRWPARWRRAPRCCCSTSRSRRST